MLFRSREGFTCRYTDSDDLDHCIAQNNDKRIQLIRYLDIVLPPNVKAILKVTPEGMEDLRYDSDGDGVYETVVAPTVSVKGEMAADKTWPDVGFSLGAMFAIKPYPPIAKTFLAFRI